MSIQIVPDKDRERFDALASHPLQSWEWGEFRKETGIEVVRLGRYEKNKLAETAQITIHPLPFTDYTIGYFPKGNIPSPDIIGELINIGKQYKSIFIKLEPNVTKEELGIRNQELGKNLQLITYNLQPSSHPLFTKYTFQLDLTKSEDELFKSFHPKTRYNIKVAQKHGVIIKEDNSNAAFEEYLKLTFETTRRQKFFAHTEKYHRRMWETLKTTKIAHLLTASYQHEGKTYILAAWILFLFNNVLYYPYGSSSNLFRNTMASNLIMWEAIRWGKKNGARLFDMWGSLGPDPDPKDPWYGFHRFKQGYGTNLVEFAGSYDLVINSYLYKIYNNIHAFRQIFLKLKSNL